MNASIKMPNKRRPDLLIVETDTELVADLRSLFEGCGLSVITTPDGKDAIDKICNLRPRAVITAIRIPKANAFEIITAVKRRNSGLADTPFIVVTSLHSAEIRDSAQKLGVSEFLYKPLSGTLIKNTVLSVLARRKDSAPATAKKPAPVRTDTARQVSSLSKLQDFVSTSQTRPQTFGEVFCLDTEEIRKRVGEENWPRLKETVSKVMIDAVEAVCQSNDVYLKSDDGSIVIVFGDDNVLRAEAAAAKAAQKVNEALFGSSETKGINVKSLVTSADGSVSSSSRAPSEVVESLIDIARKRKKTQASSASGNAPRKTDNVTRLVPATAPPEHNIAEKKGDETKKTEPKAIPSFRNELMERLKHENEQPISFQYLPIWNVQNRIVDSFICMPSRKNAFEKKTQWGYNTLGRAPKLEEIAELDFATLEFGLLKIIDFMSSGKPAMLALSVHFETLASKNIRERFLAFLEEIPGNIRGYLAPIITNVPEGIPESRLDQITNRFRNLTRFLAVEIPLSQDGQNTLETAARMRGGGIGCIMLKISDDSDTKQIQYAKKVAEKIQTLGGKVGVSGIRNRAALIELAYGGLTYCAGKAIGGPYEYAQEPYELNASMLERMEAEAC